MLSRNSDHICRCNSDTLRYVTGPLATLTMQEHGWLCGVDSHLTSDYAMYYLILRCPEKKHRDQRKVVYAREHISLMGEWKHGFTH
jgi:hypothetical protein